MKTLTEYLSPLLNQLKEKQVKENVSNLSGKLIDGQTGQLWNVSADHNEYNRNLRFLDGSLKTIVDVNKLNISMLLNNSLFFKDKPCIVIIHDGSDLRKPHSKTLENLDTVRSLKGDLIKGYPTFNSIAIDLNGQGLRLLQSTPYSTKESRYLSQGDINDYDSNSLLKARRKEVKKLLDTGDWYNQRTIVETHISRINEAIRAVNPEATIIHLYDRGHDNSALFEYHNKENSLFVTRLKANKNSNEQIINEKGKEVFVKLTKQQFFNGFEKHYDKIQFKGKVYRKVTGVFEWTKILIKDSTYSVVKVRMYDKNGRNIFKQPMLLITNMDVDNEMLTEIVFELYMKRVKIEGVFKFCKNELGWENFRIKKFEGIKNLIGLVYFIAGYFYEVENEAINHPASEWLAQLGNGKGKITPYYIIKGISKLFHFLELQELFNQSQENKEIAQQAINTFFTGQFKLE